MSLTKEEQLLYLGKIFTSWPFVEKKWTFSTDEPGAISSDPEHHVIERTEWRRARNDYLRKMTRDGLGLVHEPVMIKMAEPVMIDDNPDHSWYERGEFPPAGCECEIHHEQWPDDDWENVRIMAITDEYVIVKYQRCEQHYLLANMKFRPLRTDREKAIEDMSRIIHEHGGVINDISLGALLDAGYHKGKTE